MQRCVLGTQKIELKKIDRAPNFETDAAAFSRHPLIIQFKIVSTFTHQLPWIPPAHALAAALAQA